MPNIMDFLNTAMQQNPNIANDPQNQNLFNLIKTGKGEQYAANVVNGLGMSPQEAVSQASQFLRSKFPNIPFF